MSAIVSESLRVHHAKQFVESLSEPAKDYYYLFIGRPVSWPEGDATVPAPEDTAARLEFDYWRDIVALRRINTQDVAHVVPTHQWTANEQYVMYDHRTSQRDLANSAFYIVTPAPERAVYKCIHDGRTNSVSGASRSLVKPVIGGDVTALVTSAGNLNEYVWKYLYTISSDDAAKFQTTTWMPVRNPVDDGTEDSDAFTIFDTARSSGNGAIQSIVIDSGGSDYTGDVTAEIIGDGTGAVAQPVVSGNKVTSINVIAGGQDYTWATVRVSTSNTGSGATASAIISPRHAHANSNGTFYVTNHGINLIDELFAKRVMLSIELDGDTDGLVTGNDYRRVGIIRNPVLYGTNTRATANTYKQTTVLTVTPRAEVEFTLDELVWQPDSNAYGVVVQIAGNDLSLVNVVGTFEANKTVYGIGNGSVDGHGIGSVKPVPATPEVFTPVVPPSGSIATALSVVYPQLQPFSGDILFVNHRTPVVRANNQTELIRTILTF